MRRTIVIIGGGVVGLNIAFALSESKKGDVFVLDKEPYLGHHTSTRNSEVIHAGFAYKPGMLKLKLCLEGNQLTYRLLEDLGVKHNRCGKWIVAYTDDEVAALRNVLANAKECGAPGISMGRPEDVVRASEALVLPRACAFSESSGIMDASSYMKALEKKLSMCDGVHLVYPCTVTGVDAAKKVFYTKERGDMEFDVLINAAGLFADDVYRMCGGKKNVDIRPFKGEYYTWRKEGIEGLIYPVPRAFMPNSDATVASNFGVHVHKTIGGDVFMGPSQIEVGRDAKEDYTIVTPPDGFVDEVRHMLCDEPDMGDISPALAGNRPKLFEGDRPKPDFEIFREGDAVHLLGIESPGLTAAPAIGKYVAGLI